MQWSHGVSNSRVGQSRSSRCQFRAEGIAAVLTSSILRHTKEDPGAGGRPRTGRRTSENIESRSGSKARCKSTSERVRISTHGSTLSNRVDFHRSKGQINGSAFHQDSSSVGKQSSSQKTFSLSATQRLENLILGAPNDLSSQGKFNRWTRVRQRGLPSILCMKKSRSEKIDTIRSTCRIPSDVIAKHTQRCGTLSEEANRGMGGSASDMHRRQPSVSE